MKIQESQVGITFTYTYIYSLCVCMCICMYTYFKCHNRTILIGFFLTWCLQDMVVPYDSLQLAHKCILNSFYGYVMRK